MSRSEKYAQSPKENWIIAILSVITLITLFSFTPGMSEFWDKNLKSKILVSGIVILIFAGSLWKYSKPYWRLADRMVDTAPKQSRAKLFVLVILLGMVAGAISYII